MSELLPVSEWDRELTDEEWEQIERDVDMGYLSYDDARGGGSWGLNRQLIRTPPRIASYRLVRASLRMRSRDLVGAVILQHLIHVLGMLCRPMHQSKSRRIRNGG